MLVAFVQGIVGAFDEHFRPLENGRSEETCDRAKDHFLEKRGVHLLFSQHARCHLAEGLMRLHRPV
jgi:hypothetical protein